MPNWTLHQGECLDVLKTLPDNSVDSVVTDPPYGLSNHDAGDVREALRCWLDGKPYTPKGKGFMGKDWDAFVPGPEVWRECLRVLKPGGHLLVFAGTRTQDLMGIAVRLAGFDARDSLIVHGMLHWQYASGAMVKSLDVSKALSKVEGAAKAWEGWGTGLRPSQEPILVFRKPLIGTVAANVLAHGTGALNIDGCRIEGVPPSVPQPDFKSVNGRSTHLDANTRNGEMSSATGRWPTNTLLCHTPDCRQTGTRNVRSGRTSFVNNQTGATLSSYGGGWKRQKRGEYLDPDGTETITAWDCADGCPVKALDEQSGDRPSTLKGVFKAPNPGKSAPGGCFGLEGGVGAVYGDTGGASRFYPQFSYGEGDNPFLYCSKASRSERDGGCEDLPKKRGPVMSGVCQNCGKGQLDGRREGPCCDDPDYTSDAASGNVSNHHPTVKPIALMRWLARLVTPTNGVVLDPFNGSGTTGCAAVLEGFQYIGIERDPEYVEIARARITHHERVVQGGVKNPWTEKPVTEKPTVEATETTPLTLDDLFGF